MADLHPRVLDQLEDLTLDPARPLIAVDADEVMVVLAAHLKRYLARHDVDLRLTAYRLEGSMFPKGTEQPLGFQESLAWIGRFFEDEVARQEAVPGAAEALARLASLAQIVVLTNVPRHGKEGRIANLAGLGMGYPLIENTGGKGPALAWMAARIQGPMVFIDDSPNQIESAIMWLPDILAIHFKAAPLVSDLLPDSPFAQECVTSWSQCETLIAKYLASHSKSSVKGRL